MDSICSRDPIAPMSGVKIFVAGPDVWRPVLGYGNRSSIPNVQAA